MLDTTTILLTPPKESLWTEEKEQTLRRLWDGGLTCSQISGEFAGEFSRNAVIGKVRRMNLSRRSRSCPILSREERAARDLRRELTKQARRRERWSIRSPEDRAKQTAAREAAQLMVKAEQEARRIALGAAPKGFECSLLELDHYRCHFPDGDPGAPDFHFCGAPPLDGRSYCKFHHALTHDGPRTLARPASVNGRSYQRQDAR